MRGRGYFEDKVPTPNGDIALEHQKTALLVQMGRNPPLNVPMVPPPERKRQAQPPAGWQRTIEGYGYEKLISQTHTIHTIEKRVLRGTVIANHAILSLYTYRKDVGTLSELQDKERTLEAKLSGYVTSDPEYHMVAEKLYETKEKIRAIKKDEVADVEVDIKLEDWYSGDLQGDDYVEWSEKFMEKSLLEAEQVMKQYAPKQEIKL